MSKKTLIINGSPRVNGNTAVLIREMRKYLEGDVVEISAYRSRVAPCVDCRACWTTGRCCVRDDMDLIYGDDFDNVVIASPIYYGTLTGPMMSLMSRMQPWHAARYFLKQPISCREKKGAAILTAGGMGSHERARCHLFAFFKMLNAQGFEEHMAVSDKTDTLPAENDENALQAARAIALWLNA